MRHEVKVGVALVASLLLATASMAAELEHGAAARPAVRQAEPHPGPHGYQRVTEPSGWNTRPATVDRGVYQHNFQAARSFRIGPYHRPSGYVVHRWGFGEILPRAYWAAPYILADYWLFALEEMCIRDRPLA